MRARKILLIVGFLLIGLALGGLALRKTVTLVVNGESRKITTFAFTVGELLRGQGLTASQSDHLQPPSNHWLQTGDQIELDNAAQVQIRADGKIVTLLSPERTPKTLLNQAGIALYPGDQLFSDGASITPEAPLPYAPDHTLDVRRVVSFTLVTDSGTEKYTSTAATLGEALWQAGITLYATDRLQPPPETPLTAGLQAQLTRSQEITVHTQVGEVRLRSAASTVGEVLAQAGLSLQGLDYSRPPAEETLPADGQIRLVRVREEVILEQSSLPFTTTWQAVDTLELDNQMLVQAGVPGINAVRVRVRFEDGVEVARQVEIEWIASPSQTEIMGYGMLIVPHTLETPDGTITYYRALSFWTFSSRLAPRQSEIVRWRVNRNAVSERT